MTTSESDAVVAGKKVGKLFGKEQDILTDGGINVKLARTELDAGVEEVLALDAQQEALKRATKAVTTQLEAARERLYMRASGWLDMAIAAVDKNSAKAKNFRRIRTSLHYRKRATSSEASA